MTLEPWDLNILWTDIVNFLQNDWWVLLLVILFFIYAIKTM